MLAKLRIATKENADTIAKVLAIIVGIVYAATFEVVRSLGPVVDFFLRIAFGAMWVRCSGYSSLWVSEAQLVMMRRKSDT